MYYITIAGVMHSSVPGLGPRNHISSLSTSAIWYLASHLNDRDVYSQFCYAMKIKDELIHSTARTMNPTAQLLQILAESPSGTMQRLQEALESIGKIELYESARKLNDNYL